MVLISIEGFGSLFFSTRPGKPRAARRCKGGAAGSVAQDARWVTCRDRSGAGRGDPPFVAGVAGCGPWLFLMLAFLRVPWCGRARRCVFQFAKGTVWSGF